ncbi:MAG: Rossmann-like domain-containing protein [Promethearchaeota archaeon]
MLIEKTVEIVERFFKKREIMLPKVTKIVIGLGYTGVEINFKGYEPFLGLASTLSSIVNITDCSKIEFAGNLTNRTLTELLEWSYSPPSIKKIVGIATLNSLSQFIITIKNTYTKLKGDLLNYLSITKDTNVTVIGLIKPLIRKIQNLTNKITLIDDTIPISKEFSQLNFKRSIEQLEEEDFLTDILICTGTVLINDTFEQILTRFGKKTPKIIIIGPSASMIPDILFDNGVDIVGGMEIFDSKATLRVLQEGGGTKIFKQYGKKYNLIKK